MRPFTDIRRDAHRLCSDFSAGRVSLDALEVGVAELLRQRAGCDSVALWRRAGHGIDEELRSKGPSHRGVIDDASGRPAPVPSIALSIYLAWKIRGLSDPRLARRRRGRDYSGVAPPLQLRCRVSPRSDLLQRRALRSSLLLGSLQTSRLAWPATSEHSGTHLVGDDLPFPPKAVTRRTDILPRQTGCERHGSGTM